MMTFERLGGTTNVVRFPVEQCARPSMELLRDIRPDLLVLLANADAFGFEPPSSMLQADADRETAAYIETETPRGARPSAAFLGSLVQPVVARAITAAREAVAARAEATAARQRAVIAIEAGESAAEWLQNRAATAMVRATELGLIAHGIAEQAEGVARAVQFARQGQPWMARSAAADDDELIAMASARLSSGRSG